MRLGEPRLALEDLNTVIDLAREPDPISFFSRGLVYRHLGQYQKALENFDCGEAIEPKRWEEDVVFGLLYRADLHARLGDEASALAYRALYRTTFGLRAFTALLAAAKPTLPTSCAALRRTVERG